MTEINTEGLEVTAEFVQALRDMNGRDIRTLKWKLKQISKQAGKQGATIYALRNENAALREAITWNPGDRARLCSTVSELNQENQLLKEKLAAKDEANA